MKELKRFELTPEEHKKRSLTHLEAGKAFANSVEVFDFSTLEKVNYVLEEYPEVVIAGKDPRENVTPFGPIGTVASGGCITYVGTMILKNYGHNVDVVTLAGEAAQKGYRSWGFKKYLKKYFTSPNIDINEVKAKFGDDIPAVNDCKTVEELEEILGEVTGIGGSAFLLDNIISMLSAKELKPVADTRITSMDKVLENLKNGIMVPLRVKNAIYLDDPKKADGHYIILVGISNGTAILIDSSIGINKVPAERLFKAVIENERLISVWDLSNI